MTMPFPRFAPRLTLSGLLTTTAIVAIALTLFATYDRFAILLLVGILAAIAFVGLAWPRRMFTKRYSVTCGMISLATAAYLCAVVPATWMVARLHTLDSSGRPEYVFAFQCVLDPAAECWVDSPAPIRAAFIDFLNLGMPPNASLDEYPCGFGYTTFSTSGGSANVILHHKRSSDTGEFVLGIEGKRHPIRKGLKFDSNANLVELGEPVIFDDLFRSPNAND